MHVKVQKRTGKASGGGARSSGDIGTALRPSAMIERPYPYT